MPQIQTFKYNLNDGYSNHNNGYVRYKMADLLHILEKNPDIRKIFGKRELIIIKKQLLGVKLTQSEKNRLSRDIRKKFDAIQKLANYEEEFELKYKSELNKQIEEIKEIILESKYSPKIKKIVLYGSSADNTRTFRSDVDIAVEFSHINSKEATLFRIDILKDFRENIDVQVYNELPKKIKKEIDSKGRVLYERKN